VVVPNGVDCEHFRPVGLELPGRTLLFFGALDYYPNVDAILSFHDAIWPRLRDRYPDLELDIVGRQPPAAVRALASDARIGVSGFVDDIRPWIERASVVVVPLRAGSGTRLKVLEAMAMARPVVSTRIGVEGLDVVDGTHLLVADSTEEFAHAVEMFLDDPGMGRALGLTGRALVEAHYDWRAIGAAFGAFVEGVVKRHQAESNE
jgi:glycosyltransferase involved in cell wall biosynthesis